MELKKPFKLIVRPNTVRKSNEKNSPKSLLPLSFLINGNLDNIKEIVLIKIILAEPLKLSGKYWLTKVDTATIIIAIAINEEISLMLHSLLPKNSPVHHLLQVLLL